MSQPITKVATPGSSKARTAQSIFALCFGLFLSISLLKFGNPPIFEKWVAAPSGVYEFLLGFPWPISWAYKLMVLVLAAGALNVRLRPASRHWLIALPVLWVIWQLMATIQSVDPSLSEPTLKHFVVCALCFYLGYFALSRIEQLWPFWLVLLSGFLVVLGVGFEQHFGGLEETRRYFFVYIYPNMGEVSPEYLKKMSSTRIFSTLFYPNALAGMLLLLLPVILALLAETRRFTFAAKSFLMFVIGLSALACLYWSGSKGGWLLMLFLTVVALFRLRMEARYKRAMIFVIVIASLTAFGLKYAGFFRKGATSVSARFDYWHAAVATAKSSPIFGTGPGTFAIPYAKIKRPDSEMSRLVHNDYLEQASDSGVAGFLIYCAMIVGFLYATYPRTSGAGESWVRFAIWLGLLGFSLQSLMEFGLYIPALAWTGFTMFGLSLGNSNKEKPSTNSAGLASVQTQ